MTCSVTINISTLTLDSIGKNSLDLKIFSYKRTRGTCIVVYLLNRIVVKNLIYKTYNKNVQYWKHALPYNKAGDA